MLELGCENATVGKNGLKQMDCMILLKICSNTIIFHYTGKFEARQHSDQLEWKRTLFDWNGVYRDGLVVSFGSVSLRLCVSR